VEAEAGRGYRLARPLGRLDAGRIRALLPADRALRRLEVLPRTDSTNQRLLEADAADDPQALFAEAQTAGRGRRGRQWRSPFGANLYLSLAWSFPAWPPQLSALSLAVGVACGRALRAAGLREVMLKWPNDLRVGAAKLGGILIEQRGEAGGSCRVVIGIGINVAMSAAQAGELGQPWISLDDALAQAGREAPERNGLAAALLGELLAALERFQVEGFTPFLPDWAALDAQGALIVEAQGRRHHVHSGEVSLRLESAA
jgi:BirA family biotin operon repressor/biotin-[acetyl-CoA-carboxylase] ligase